MPDTTATPPFHLAFPVNDLAKARQFYGELLGCAQGRSSDCWVDFNFFGHQVVAHLVKDYRPDAASNVVDGEHVPARHFGVVLSMEQWKDLEKRLRAANVVFLIEPQIRFRGETGEQAIMFFRDPAGNALEFKAFADMSQLFAT